MSISQYNEILQFLGMQTNQLGGLQQQNQLGQQNVYGQPRTYGELQRNSESFWASQKLGPTPLEQKGKEICEAFPPNLVGDIQVTPFEYKAIKAFLKSSARQFQFDYNPATGTFSESSLSWKNSKIIEVVKE